MTSKSVYWFLFGREKFMSVEEQDAELFGPFQDVDVSMISKKSDASFENKSGNSSFLYD